MSKKKTYIRVFVIILALSLLYFIGSRHFETKNVQKEDTMVEEYFYASKETNIIEINSILYDKSQGTIYTSKYELIVDSVDWLYQDKYAYIMPFSRNQKRGFIDTQNGVILVTPKYDHAWVFRENLAAVVINQCLFYIDKHDSIILKGFDYVEYKDYYFEHGVAMAGKDTLVGLIDTGGRWVVKPNYTYILSNRNSEILRAFSLNHTITEFSTKGVVVNSCVCRRAIFNMLNNPDIVVYEADRGWYGLMDINGNILTKPIYKNFVSIDGLGENILYRSENNRWGIMSSNGHVLTKDIFESYSDFK